MNQELTILKEVSHPHIMRVLELLHDKSNYYIVTELMEGGELFDRIIEVETFDEIKAAKILKQVLLAVNYMHQQGMAHRDLKPDNILLESKDLANLEVKLADFGFSCFVD